MRLYDWIVPDAALRWGRLTQPPPLEVTITVDTSRWTKAARAIWNSNWSSADL